MLVLSRKTGQSVQVGEGIVIKVLDLGGGRVRLGIEAPRDVAVLRAELGPADERRTRELPQPIAHVA